VGTHGSWIDRKLLVILLIKMKDCRISKLACRMKAQAPRPQWLRRRPLGCSFRTGLCCLVLLATSSLLPSQVSS